MCLSIIANEAIVKNDSSRKEIMNRIGVHSICRGDLLEELNFL